ncbi:hypothetical protein [Streptomyces umbrinus]|uniref:hypothetical protein n=1 Tax=Streptomyces umbrinus TaxID=67370 RepID=UPI00340A8ABE
MRGLAPGAHTREGLLLPAHEAATVLFEMHDEWIAFPRRYLPEGSMDEIYADERPDSAPALPSTTNATDD